MHLCLVIQNSQIDYVLEVVSGVEHMQVANLFLIDRV